MAGITEIGHVAVQVRDIAAAEEFATGLLGLHVTQRAPGSVWLTEGTRHHTLQYVEGDHDAIDRVGLVALGRAEVDEIRNRVESAGLEIADVPLSEGVEYGFVFLDAEGFAFEIYSGMAAVDAVATHQLRPRRLGHINVFAKDPRPMQDMLIDLLGFRVSDRAGAEGAFLRCNVDHHAFGVFPGPGNLHHVAWEYPTVVELVTLADMVDATGGSTIWGPMRHGIGRNIAFYVEEPSGLLVEFYCDMERIYNENHVPGAWDLEQGHKWMSLWAVHFPQEGFMEMGLPPVSR